MANEKINIDLVINSSQAAKTLKEQKQALKDINEALGEVKYGSGAFELLTDEAKRLTNQLGALNVSFEDVYGEMKPLQTQLGEIEDRLHMMAMAGEENTQAFRDLQAEAVKIKKGIREVDDTIDAMSQRGAGLRGIVSIAQSIAGGFAVAQSASRLFGDENKNLEESLMKVATIMELLSGLEAINTALKEKNVVVSSIQNGIRKLTVKLVGEQAVAMAAEAAATNTATIAQKALNLAMAANPVGLFIVAITALIGVFSLLNSSEEDEISNQREAAIQRQKNIDLLADELDLRDRLNNLNTFSNADLEDNIALMKAKGASDKQIYEAERALIQANIEELTAQATNRGVLFNQESKEYADFVEKKKKLQNSLEILDANYTKKVNDNKAEQTKKTLEENKKRQQSEEEYFDYINTRLREYESRLTDTYHRIDLLRKEDTYKQYDSIKEEYNTRLKSLENGFREEQKALKKALENGVISRKTYNSDLNKIQNKNNDEKIALEREYNMKYNDLWMTNVAKLKELNIKNQLDQKNIDISNKEAEFERAKESVNNSELTEKEKADKLLLINLNFNEQLKELYNERKTLEDNYNEEKFNNQNLDLVIQKNNNDFELNSTKEKYEKLKALYSKYYGGYTSEALSATSLVSSSEYESYENNKKHIDEIVNKSTEADKKKVRSNKEATENELKELEKKINQINQSNKSIEESQVTLSQNTEKAFTDSEKAKVDASKKTETEITNIQKKALYDREADMKSFRESMISSIGSTLTLINNIVSNMYDSRITASQNNLQEQLNSIDAEQKAYEESLTQRSNAEQAQLDKQAEFENRKKELQEKQANEERALKQKQFNINKGIQLANIAINTAVAVTKALAELGPFGAFGVGVSGALQAAIVMAQQPTFARGGLLDGPSHSQGGIKTSFGELEGGEYVVNKKNTQLFLPVLDALNSYGGNGKSVLNSTPKTMYQNGGNLPMNPTNITTNNIVDTSNIEMILQNYLSQPIETYVKTSEITNNQNKIQKIQKKNRF